MVKVLALTDVQLPPTMEATYVPDELSLAHEIDNFGKYDVLVVEIEKIGDAILRLLIDLGKPIVAISSTPSITPSLDKKTLSEEALEESILQAQKAYVATILPHYRELENVSIGIVHLSRKGEVTHWNSAAETITGLSRSDVVGKTCAEIIELLYYDVPTIGRAIEALDNGKSASFRIMRKDSTLRYICIKCISGGTYCSTLQIVDETSSKVILDRVRETEARVTAILNAVQECVMQFDDNGCVTHNAVCGNYLSMSHEQISRLTHQQFHVGRYDISGKLYDVQKKVFSIGGDNYTVVTIDDVTQVETLKSAIGILAHG